MSQTVQQPRQPNIALLIDGDNAQPKLFDKILLEVARFGRPTIRRIYGDWTAPNMSSWKVCLQEFAINPVQQFRNTVGKNATDSALIIDAMDILYSQSVRCFCIVSSDSDFTRLATRIRQDGILMIGIGKKTTPPAFVKACDVFIYTENLEVETVKPCAEPVTLITEAPASAQLVPAKVSKQAKPAESSEIKASKTAKKNVKLNPPVELLKKAFAMSVQEDGWANLGALGESLRRIDPAFDPRTWGYPQLSLLINAAHDHFLCKRNRTQGPASVHVKIKNSK